jgi:hypothetical protein
LARELMTVTAKICQNRTLALQQKDSLDHFVVGH